MPNPGRAFRPVCVASGTKGVVAFRPGSVVSSRESIVRNLALPIGQFLLPILATRFCQCGSHRTCRHVRPVRELGQLAACSISTFGCSANPRRFSGSFDESPCPIHAITSPICAMKPCRVSSSRSSSSALISSIMARVMKDIRAIVPLSSFAEMKLWSESTTYSSRWITAGLTAGIDDSPSSPNSPAVRALCAVCCLRCTRSKTVIGNPSLVDLGTMLASYAVNTAGPSTECD